MEYHKIVAVTGMPGLFEIVSSKSDGAIVRSLENNATKFISSRIHNLSHLETIEVYTTDDNVNLSSIFTAMKASDEPLPDTRNNAELKAYFEKVYPSIDFERVYSSDLKKMVKWFETLQKNNVDFAVREQQPEATAVATATVDAPTEAQEQTEATTETPAET